MKPDQSEIQQIRCGTLKRNQRIIKLHESEIINNMAELGRMFNMTRQAIKNIIDRDRNKRGLNG